MDGSLAAKKERPIIFSAPMVCAILEGRKTMTRRVVKPRHEIRRSVDLWEDRGPRGKMFSFPYGQSGERLWVREAFGYAPASLSEEHAVIYRADHATNGWKMHRPDLSEFVRWRPSIHMPHWASRILLEVANVRIERVQDISEEDARAEGCQMGYDGPYSFRQGFCYRGGFIDIWNSLNAKRGNGWDANPWVWVVGFKVIRP